MYSQPWLDPPKFSRPTIEPCADCTPARMPAQHIRQPERGQPVTGRTTLSFSSFCHGIVFSGVIVHFLGQIAPVNFTHSRPAAHTSHRRADFTVHGLGPMLAFDKPLNQCMALEHPAR